MKYNQDTDTEEKVIEEAEGGEKKYRNPITFRPTPKDLAILDEILERYPFIGRNRSNAIRVALEHWHDDSMKGPRCSRCGTELEEKSRGNWTCKVCNPENK